MAPCKAICLFAVPPSASVPQVVWPDTDEDEPWQRPVAGMGVPLACNAGPICPDERSSGQRRFLSTDSHSLLVDFARLEPRARQCSAGIRPRFHPPFPAGGLARLMLPDFLLPLPCSHGLSLRRLKLLMEAACLFLLDTVASKLRRQYTSCCAFRADL